MSETGFDVWKVWHDFYTGAPLITDAPAPTPTAEKPEVGRWYRRHDNHRLYTHKYITGPSEPRDHWGRLFGEMRSTTTWQMPKGAGVTWQTRDAGIGRAEAVDAPVYRVTRVDADGTVAVGIGTDFALAAGPEDGKRRKPETSEPIFETTCVRCGLRFMTPNTLRDRCDVCLEQQVNKLRAEAIARGHRREDEKAAQWTRKYNKIRMRPTARIESDPYEAPASGRGGMVGGIVRMR